MITPNLPKTTARRGLSFDPTSHESRDFAHDSVTTRHPYCLRNRSVGYDLRNMTLSDATRAAKIAFARVLTSSSVGHLIQRLFPRGIRRHGCLLFVGDRAVSPTMAAALYWNLYERSELRLLRQLRSDLDVIELGASIGAMSAALSRRLKPHARLICVEPNPFLLPLLQKHLRMNGDETRTVIISSAIDYSGGDHVPLRLERDNICGRVAGSDDSSDNVITISTTTLAALVSQINSDYILIADIEGAEFAMIEHDRTALQRCRQLLIEFHRPDAVKHALALLAEIDLHVVDQRGSVYLLNKSGDVSPWLAHDTSSFVSV